MRPANHDFEDNCILGDMAMLNLDFQIGQRLHQLLVEQPDSVAALIVFAPGLVIVPRTLTEGSEDAFKIMLVLEP
jgi:hypothetical protein